MAIHNKLNILSPISDKSSQEPGSETSDINNRNNNSQKQSPVDGTTGGGGAVAGAGSGTLSKKEGEESAGGGVVGTEAVKTNVTKRRSAPNKALLLITGKLGFGWESLAQWEKVGTFIDVDKFYNEKKGTKTNENSSTQFK